MAEFIPDSPDFDRDVEIAERLDAVHRCLRLRTREELQPLGVTPAQVRALRTIAGEDCPVRMSALAARLGIARRSATDVVDQLVEAGLVTREHDPADRRGVAVAATKAGRKLLDQLASRRLDAVHELLAELDGTERAQLAALLGRLVPR